MVKKQPVRGPLATLTMILFSCLIVHAPAFGAVRQSSLSSSEKIIGLLEGPFQVAIDRLYKTGPTAYKDLRKISFSDQYSVKLRWKAFMALTRIGGRDSLPEIEQALKSNDWFMRNAGLLALEQVHFMKAARRAKKIFVQDKALLVRSKAIEVLRNSPTRKTRQLMWRELYADKNYYRGKSLWIRNHIARFLADYGKKSDLKSFLELLQSDDLEDRDLKPLVLPAVERLLGIREKKNMGREARVAFWTQRLRKVLR